MLSPAITHDFPVNKLYHLLENYSWQDNTYILETGVSVVLYVSNPGSCDYIGGHLEYADAASSHFVEVLKITGNRILGKAEDDSFYFRAGTHFWFEPKHIHRVRGNLDWNIKNLNVKVSEKILHEKEKVGYFYNTLSEKHMSFGRVFYAISEIMKPKDDIELVEVPLTTLVEIDPSITSYLEDHAMDGWLRTDDLTFRSLENEPCNRRIFPAGYETDDIFDPPAEDLDFNF